MYNFVIHEFFGAHRCSCRENRKLRDNGKSCDFDGYVYLGSSSGFGLGKDFNLTVKNYHCINIFTYIKWCLDKVAIEFYPKYSIGYLSGYIGRGSKVPSQTYSIFFNFDLQTMVPTGDNAGAYALTHSMEKYNTMFYAYFNKTANASILVAYRARGKYQYMRCKFNYEMYAHP